MQSTSNDETLRDFYVIPADSPEDIQAKLLRVVTDRIPNRFNLHPIQDVQVLTPMNHGSLGSRALNEVLQQALNPDTEPRVSRFGWTYAPGDKVIQTINDYEKDTFNGDIGRVVRVEPENSTVIVDFDGRHVDYEFGELDEVALAYTATVHKSQGSEYPAVVIPLSTQHYPMLERNLLYTGVTDNSATSVGLGQKATGSGWLTSPLRTTSGLGRPFLRLMISMVVRFREPHYKMTSKMSRLPSTARLFKVSIMRWVSASGFTNRPRSTW